MIFVALILFGIIRYKNKSNDNTYRYSERYKIRRELTDTTLRCFGYVLGNYAINEKGDTLTTKDQLDSVFFIDRKFCDKNGKSLFEGNFNLILDSHNRINEIQICYEDSLHDILPIYIKNYGMFSYYSWDLMNSKIAIIPSDRGAISYREPKESTRELCSPEKVDFYDPCSIGIISEDMKRDQDGDLNTEQEEEYVWMWKNSSIVIYRHARPINFTLPSTEWLIYNLKGYDDLKKKLRPKYLKIKNAKIQEKQFYDSIEKTKKKSSDF